MMPPPPGNGRTPAGAADIAGMGVALKAEKQGAG